MKLGIIMDPIEAIDPTHDTSFTMLLEAQQRDWQIHYLQQQDLFWLDGKAYANSTRITVEDSDNYYTPHEQQTIELSDLDIILMRKDPPVDIPYIYTTYFLDHAKANGSLVVNDPEALRNTNEKFIITHFPQCCAPTLIATDSKTIQSFFAEHQDIIVKPLDGMAGDVFRVQDETTLLEKIDYLTQQQTLPLMAQCYLPEIAQGDKRIIMINGEPIMHALARFPAEGSVRANLAAGGRGEVMPLTEREQWICQQVGPYLKANGILFAGLDVIGDYLTEINVTSPTCVREIEADADEKITQTFFDTLVKKLS